MCQKQDGPNDYKLGNCDAKNNPGKRTWSSIEETDLDVMNELRLCLRRDTNLNYHSLVE